MKQKIALYAVVVVLVLSVLACGKSTVTTPTSTPLPPVTDTPIIPAGDLVIVSTNAFVDTYGTYRVVGEIVNNGSAVLTSMELTIEIKDAAGNSLLKDENGNIVPNATFSPMLYTTGPGEYNPFEYSYDTTNGTPASYNVTVTGQATGETNRATVSVENVQLMNDGSGSYYLTGELVNTGSQWAYISGLAGGGIDDSNNTLTADWTATYTTVLAPTGDAAHRDRTPFEISFPDPGGVTNWAVWLDAEVNDTVTDYPMSVDVTSTYFDEFGSAHLVGWVTNHSDQPLNSLVGGGLYSDDGTTLDASYAFLPIPVKPGAAVPFNVSSFGSVNYNQAQASLVSTFSAQFDTWFTYPPTSDSVDLSATGGTVQKDGATWTFSGNVANTSSQSLGSITVVAMVMDASGNLMAMEYSTIYPTGDAIAAGEINTYSMDVYLDPTADLTGYTTTTMVVGDVR